ncbi:hypothetical protein [Caballeronia sp. SL2Y3]|uniref:hypothetical protein n=1 Tax=Caballeronia sp. SL2Y3 TaxID=2878151 RepID=UPI001FCF975B|nr:hypothetical protein [Caballeronia sp. SL2Y3]
MKGFPVSDDDEKTFWDEFDRFVRSDEGDAAKEHLAAGFPIYVQTDETPDDVVEKRYPDGRVEFVTFDRDGEKSVIL